MPPPGRANGSETGPCRRGEVGDRDDGELGQDVTPGRGELPNQGRNRRYALVAGAVIVVAALVAGGLYLASSSQSNKPSAQSSTTAPGHQTTVPKTTTSATAPTTTTTPPPGIKTSVSVSLPVVTCPTSFATPPANPPAIPKFMQVTVPNNLANQLYVYTDQDSIMALIAPSGWVCQADYKADGSGGVSVYPGGEVLPSSPLAPGATAQAVVASQTGGCAGCAVLQACPLFATAATAYQGVFSKPCPTTRPSSEAVVPISGSTVSFSDPPGTSGNGIPSGGAYPAHGVMTYHPQPNASSWLDTCTLPSSEQPICTIALNRFIASYGST